MASNTLVKAKRQKNDEYYTQITDIEKELKYYREVFRGKTIFCNCDDPEYSNFWRYFQLNFYDLGLKKLISTHYDEEKSSYRMDIVSTDSGEQCGIPDFVKTPLIGNGDFRSTECIEILKEADIVITNPPFSLFREYLAQLIEYGKKFIIVANKNAITYKEVFQLMSDDKIWIGYRNINSDMWLEVPEGQPYEKIVDGKKLKHIMACWITNIEITKRYEDLTLYKTYNPADYPKFDNYDAINVDKVSEIPCDYYGIMGVPITFMNSYNPDQFEILGLSQKCGYGLESTKFYDDYIEYRPDGTPTGSKGRKTNGNPVLAGKDPKKNYYSNGYETVYSQYARIFIRRKR